MATAKIEEYIRLCLLQLNGMVERSRRKNEEEFYQLLAYEDDVDFEGELAHWVLKTSWRLQW
jgi:hypothetical protein